MLVCDMLPAYSSVTNLRSTCKYSLNTSPRHATLWNRDAAASGSWAAVRKAIYLSRCQRCWQPMPDPFTSTYCNRHTRYVNSDSSFRPAQPLPRAAAAPLLREAEALLVTEAAAPGQQDAVHATLQRLALAERLGEADATLLLSALWHQASTVLPFC